MTSQGLEETERVLLDALAAAPWGIHVYDLRPDGALVFVHANDAAERILRVNHEPFVGRTIEEAFPALSRTEIPSRYREVAAHRRTWHADVPYDFAGILGLFEVYAFPTTRARMAAMFQDATERRRSAAALADSESLYRSLVEHSPDGIFRADRQGEVIFVNRKLCEISGLSAEQALGQGWKGSVHPDDRERVVAEWSRAVAQGCALRLEFRFVAPEGRIAWVSGSAVPVHSNGHTGFIGTLADITERMRAERRLRLVESSVQRAAEPTFWVTMDGRMRFVNEAASRALGYSRQELEGMLVGEIDPLVLPDTWKEHWADVRRRGSVVIESVHRHKDGHTFPVEISLHYVEFEGEEWFFAFARDISQRKRNEQERLQILEREQAARAQAQEANSAKDQFLAVVSHELRNPLAPILAGVDLLAESVNEGDPRALRCLEIIRRNARLEGRLLDDLLDLSRVVRGKITLKRAPVNLEAVVHLAVDSLQQDFASAEIDLTLRVQPGLWVEGDADRLQQVVMNLLTNALNFTPSGGSVSVVTEAVSERANIIVADSGIGIARERLPTLFDTMFQHGAAGIRRRPGLGIGLALVRSLVEMHSGRAWAESEGLGRGSRFGVELPLVPAPIRQPTRTRETRPTNGQPLDMMLVEDNPDTREILRETLTTYSYNVTAAASGEEALALLPKAHPHVILADIGLPGIDGYEFLRRAKQLPEVASTPAFALTGFGQLSDIEKGREVGFLEHFVKPVDLAVLNEHIRARVAS